MADCTYFKVTLKPSSGASPADGFVDDKEVPHYITYKDAHDIMGSGWPSSLDNALAKARGNIRWKHIILQICSVISPIEIRVTKNEGGSGDAAPTAFEFVVATNIPESIRVKDETGKEIVGVDAVKELVARAFVQYSKTPYRVFVPSNVVKGDGDSHVPQAHYGESTQIVEVGPLASDIKSALANIDVELISETFPGESKILESQSSDNSSSSSSQASKTTGDTNSQGSGQSSSNASSNASGTSTQASTTSSSSSTQASNQPSAQTSTQASSQPSQEASTTTSTTSTQQASTASTSTAQPSQEASSATPSQASTTATEDKPQASQATSTASTEEPKK